MTITLAIIGGIVVTLSAAAKIPTAAAMFLRAFIPFIAAIHEVRDAAHQSVRNSLTEERRESDF